METSINQNLDGGYYNKNSMITSSSVKSAHFVKLSPQFFAIILGLG